VIDVAHRWLDVIVLPKVTSAGGRAAGVPL
jgi:hypothetical protein